MKTNYTSESLISFIYKECCAEESAAIKKAISTNNDLAEEYQSMLLMTQELSTIRLQEPSQTSLDIIMNHATSEVENHW